jgi:hypothetical protein
LIIRRYSAIKSKITVKSHDGRPSYLSKTGILEDTFNIFEPPYTYGREGGGGGGASAFKALWMVTPYFVDKQLQVRKYDEIEI